MSIQVPLEDLDTFAADYGPTAYVLAGVADGPPRVTHSAVRFDRADLVISVGRRAAAALVLNPQLCVLWPATVDQSMSLIVDGDVVGDIDPSGGEVRVRPTGAMRHRPAPM
jgi:hypothetical protein